jgi:hypothetical protein
VDIVGGEFGVGADLLFRRGCGARAVECGRDEGRGTAARVGFAGREIAARQLVGAPADDVGALAGVHLVAGDDAQRLALQADFHARRLAARSCVVRRIGITS